MRKPVIAKGHVYVDAQPAAQVLDLANALYCQLLRYVGQAYGRSGAEAETPKKAFLNAAIDLMHALAAVAALLVRLPANARGNVNAGVTLI